jgi:hypothetical protein
MIFKCLEDYDFENYKCVFCNSLIINPFLQKDAVVLSSIDYDHATKCNCGKTINIDSKESPFYYVSVIDDCGRVNNPSLKGGA